MTYTNLSDLLKGICDAIRAKKGTTGTIKHQDIPSEIESIESEPVLQDKTIVPTKSEQTVVADADYDGLGTVTVSGIPVSKKSVYADPVSDYTYYAGEGEFWNAIVVNKYNTFYQREFYFNNKILSKTQFLFYDNTIYDDNYNTVRGWIERKCILILVPGVGGGIKLDMDSISTNNSGISYLIAECNLDTSQSNEIWNVKYLEYDSVEYYGDWGSTIDIGTIRIVNSVDYGTNNDNTEKYAFLFELNSTAAEKLGFYTDGDPYQTYDVYLFNL